MLDLKLLQKNPEVVAAALAKRHSPLNMRTFEELDNKRRELLAQVEALKAERNRASAEVARLKRNGEDAEAFIPIEDIAKPQYDDPFHDQPPFPERSSRNPLNMVETSVDLPMISSRMTIYK